jgi:hypothetical protein
VVGTPIEYRTARYLQEGGWSIIPEAARGWAAQHAGGPIVDPVTGARQPYWFCDIQPEDRPGPGGVRAGFELMMFGRRGLAVVRGDTDAFIGSPAGSRWRQTRWALQVDASRIRHDHHRGAPPNLSGDHAAGGGRPASSEAADLLPANILGDFGNLPLTTQRFMVGPFISSGRRPQQAVVHGMTEVRGGRLVENIWSYLFNARWVAFCFLQRSVVVRNSHLSDEELWSSSSESSALARLPWNVAAWVGPVASGDEPTTPPELIEATTTPTELTEETECSP